MNWTRDFISGLLLVAGQRLSRTRYPHQRAYYVGLLGVQLGCCISPHDGEYCHYTVSPIVGIFSPALAHRLFWQRRGKGGIHATIS